MYSLSVSFTYTAIRPSSHLPGHTTHNNIIFQCHKMSTLFDSLLEQDGEEVFNLRIGAPSRPLLKKCQDIMRQASEHHLKSDDLSLLQYGPRQGHSVFRAELAKFLSNQYEDTVDSADLMVTAGATQGLALLVTLLFNPGDLAFVEDPTYFLAIKVLSEDLNLKVIGVPTDEDGINVEEFDRLLTQHGVKDRPVTHAKPFGSLLYTVPTFNNPTGSSLPPEKCEGLVKVLRKHNVLAVCDDVYNCLPFVDSEPPFTTPGPKRLFAFDKKSHPDYKGNVVSNGTFSKLLGPGLRLGWVELPECVKNLLVWSYYADSGGSFNQYTSCIVATAFKLGLVTKHVVDAREVYHSQMIALCDAIDKFLPATVTYKRPKGGYFVWLTFPSNVNCRDLQQLCKKKYRVDFNPGSACSCTGSFTNCMRLSFAFYEKHVLQEIVKTIGEALKEML